MPQRERKVPGFTHKVSPLHEVKLWGWIQSSRSSEIRFVVSSKVSVAEEK